MEPGPKRYLVTGASGFIGRAVCLRLVERGADVWGCSRKTVDAGSDGWRHLPVDLADASGVHRVFDQARPEFVVHLAGCATGKRGIEWVPRTFSANLQAAVNVLVAAQQRGVAKVIQAGSLEEPQSGEAPAVPSSPYAASKWSASAYARMMHALYGLSVSVARIFMVYGPGQDDLEKLVPYVCLAAARGECPKLASGTRQVDWVYVDDVVDGLIRLSSDGPADGSYVDLGSGQTVTTGEVATAICEISGTGVLPRFGELPERHMEQVRNADTEATRAVLGWTASTPLEVGLKRTFQWYRAASLRARPDRARGDIEPLPE